MRIGSFFARYLTPSATLERPSGDPLLPIINLVMKQQMHFRIIMIDNL
jgi:hypothetical protein